MKNIDELEKIAVLIDADNAQLSKLKAVLDEISTHGRIVLKKAYGDWKSSILKNWTDELNNLAIKPEQQPAYTTGKNATDIAMVITAMDLLYKDIYDAFVLVSSDSDFTPLAIRLRESGVFVFGVGEAKTPQSFRNACDDFILTEYLSVVSDEPEAEDAKPEKKVSHAGRAEPTEKDENPNINDVHELLKMAYDKYLDAEGWAHTGAAGSYIKRIRPDFSPKMYGFSKLSNLLEGFPQKYGVEKRKSKGNVVVVYKCL